MFPRSHSNCANNCYLTIDQAHKNHTRIEAFTLIGFRKLYLSNVKLGLFYDIDTLQTSLHNMYCYVLVAGQIIPLNNNQNIYMHTQASFLRDSSSNYILYGSIVHECILWCTSNTVDNYVYITYRLFLRFCTLST